MAHAPATIESRFGVRRSSNRAGRGSRGVILELAIAGDSSGCAALNPSTKPASSIAASSCLVLNGFITRACLLTGSVISKRVAAESCAR